MIARCHMDEPYTHRMRLFLYCKKSYETCKLKYIVCKIVNVHGSFSPREIIITRWPSVRKYREERKRSNSYENIKVSASVPDVIFSTAAEECHRWFTLYTGWMFLVVKSKDKHLNRLFQNLKQQRLIQSKRKLRSIHQTNLSRNNKTKLHARKDEFS